MRVTCTDLIVANHSRSAQGRVHFINALEAEIVQLRHTLSSSGLGPVSADGIREHLRQHGGDAIPSRQTIYRVLKRQAKEGTAHDFPS
jgi:hypothetical protein